MVELAKQRVTIPPELLNDLKSAKTLLLIDTLKPSDRSITSDIEMYMNNVESQLMSLADSYINREYADYWLNRIQQARAGNEVERKTTTSKFVSGVPKGEDWIRIKLSDVTSVQELETLVKKMKLSSRIEADDYMLISGQTPNIKSLIEEIAKKGRARKTV